MTRRSFNILALLFVTIFLPALAISQTSVAPVGHSGALFSGEPVLNAPFTADAITMVTEFAANGQRVPHYGRARYYRDSQGRIRIEQKVPNPHPGREQIVIIAPTPKPYAARSVFDNTARFAIPLGYLHWRSFPLREQDNGAWVVGIGEGKWIEGTYERTISPELQIITSSRFFDSRSVMFDYEVKVISRTEPQADLFVEPGQPVIEREFPVCFQLAWSGRPCPKSNGQ